MLKAPPLGHSALYYAIANNHPDTVNLLLKGLLLAPLLQERSLAERRASLKALLLIFKRLGLPTRALLPLVGSDDLACVLSFYQGDKSNLRGLMRVPQTILAQENLDAATESLDDAIKDRVKKHIDPENDPDAKEQHVWKALFE